MLRARRLEVSRHRCKILPLWRTAEVLTRTAVLPRTAVAAPCLVVPIGFGVCCDSVCVCVCVCVASKYMCVFCVCVCARARVNLANAGCLLHRSAKHTKSGILQQTSLKRQHQQQNPAAFADAATSVDNNNRPRNTSFQRCRSSSPIPSLLLPCLLAFFVEL